MAKYAKHFIVVTLCICFAGCNLAPGMQMGPVANPDRPDNAQVAPDIFPIGPATLARLADETAMEQSQSIQPAKVIQPAYQYVVGPQDVLRVTVWDHPELNNPGVITGAASSLAGALSSTTTSIVGSTATDSTSRVVQDDGTIFFPFVGVVEVAGKTPEQIRSFLTRALAKSIRDPQVEVVVASFRSSRAYVTGEVKTPGVLPISDVPLTVADAIAAAGGLNLDADLSNATLLHAGTAVNVDLYSLLYRGNIKQNLSLSSGDILNIPEQRFNKVFVLGEVVKPSSVLMPRGDYTLNEALADSGGTNQSTAKASQIYVIRGTPEHPQVYHLNAQQPDALVMADRFLLKPRDIIFVDATEMVRYNRVISLVLPALQALQAGKYLGQ